MNAALIRTRVIGIIALIAIAALSWIFLLAPALNKPNEVAEKVAAAEKEKDQIENQIVTAKATVKSLPSLKADIKQLEKRFPSNSDPGLLAQSINNVARKSGISPNDVVVTADEPIEYDASKDLSALSGEGGSTTSSAAPDPQSSGGTAAPSADTVLVQKVTISASGSPSQLAEFASRLGKNKRVMLVADLNIGASGDATTTGTTTTTPDTTTDTSEQTGTMLAYTFLLPPVEPLSKDVAKVAKNSSPAANYTINKENSSKKNKARR